LLAYFTAMPTNIKCPHCANEFDVENVLSSDIEQKLKQQYEKQLQQSLAQLNDEKKDWTTSKKNLKRNEKIKTSFFSKNCNRKRQNSKTSYSYSCVKA